MNRRIAFTLAAGIAAATLALTGCGGEQTGSTPAAAPSASTAPSASAAPSASTAETTPPTTPGAGSTPTEEPGGDGAKPSKQEIVAGLSTFYEKTQGLPADKAEKFAVCMVDAMYDTAETATLEAMRDGDTSKIAMSDAGLVAEAGFGCQSVLA